MANCTTLTTIIKSCSNNQGGIYSVYINDTNNVTITASASTHQIASATASPKFTTFEFNRNVGSVTIDPKIDLINGSTYYEAKVSLQFNRREAATSRALTIIGEGQRFLEIIFLDANGIYWYLDHAQLDGGTEVTGTMRADGSKYTVTFTALMDNRPYEIAKSIVTTVI
jgi:hypothetical protein